MLPNESENRETIRNRFSGNFAISATLTDELVRFLDDLREMDIRFSDTVKAFVLGTLARETRRYRAIVAVCELGLTESADALVRTMYEGVLSLKYVFDLKISVADQSVELQNVLKNLPSPGEVEIQDFRVGLYRAMAASSYLCLMKEYGETDPEAEQNFLNVQASIPPAWQEVQRKRRSYSGLNIKQLAEYCGMATYHNRIYPQHCHISHANDAMSFVKRTGDGNAWVQLATDIQEVGRVLYLASEIAFWIVDAIEKGLRCEANMDELYKEHKDLANNA